MENWLNINQSRALEWGLNSNEEKLCAYYAKSHSWVSTRIIDENGDYLCIAITKLIQELPTIGRTKPNFSRSLNSLAEKQVFDKYINNENKKEVYYRFNPFFLKCWRDNSSKIASDINNKSLITLTQNECNNFVIGVTEMKQGVTEMKPIRKTNQINNQINNNHNKGDDSLKSVTKMKHHDIKKEFERILEIYPHTVHNTNEKIAEAFGVFLTFTPTERFNVFKAVKNYSNTENVQNQKATKYILGIYTFLTKSYTNFIHGLPKNFTYADKFEQKKSQVGADKDESLAIVYEQEDIDILKIYARKFESIKNRLKSENIDFIDDKYNDSWVKDIFKSNELEIIFVKMGGLNNVNKYSSTQLAESLFDILKVENE